MRAALRAVGRRAPGGLSRPDLVGRAGRPAGGRAERPSALGKLSPWEERERDAELPDRVMPLREPQKSKNICSPVFVLA